MKGLKMEKEISISKTLEAKVNSNLSLEENFNKIANYLAEKFEIKLCLCNIKGGRRWSYVSGYSEMIVNKNKIKINDSLGIIYSINSEMETKKVINSNQWSQIIALIKKIAKTTK